MPVDTPHPEYERMKPKWTRARDAYDGEDAVKAAGAEYLPMLGGQTSGEYEAYKSRAWFYGATNRTVQGLAGAIMRKDPQVEVPESYKEKLESITKTRDPIEALAHEVVQEQLTVGRVGVYVDAAEDGEGEPYITTYFAENIISWRTEPLDGRDVLVRLVLKEAKLTPDPDDPFEFVEEPFYRVLRLVEQQGEDEEILFESPNGTYVVEIWEKEETSEGKKDEQWVMQSRTVPTKRGGAEMDFIPFVIINATSVGADVERPPILDLVNMNLSHYRNAADLEHGLHFTALPTAWVAGFDPDSTELKIGSQTAWVSKDPHATAGFLEFSGSGLGSIREQMQGKERLMAVLGARLLEEQKRDSEAAETVRLRQSSESNVLSSIAHHASAGLTRALQWYLSWILATGEVSIELNQDFIAPEADAVMIQTLMAALQGGEISWDTWFFNLQRAGVTPDNHDAETERSLIETGQPRPEPEETV